MTYTPEGYIYLCECPLENDYKNQLTFTSYEAQESYFNSIVKKSYSDYTYIKKDNMIKVNSTIDEIINCNYLFYKNNSISEKIYYCFITRMEYVNTNVTAIYFETDSFQTYWGNITYNPCFIEREHVNDDRIGYNLVPENLETGDYVIKSSRTVKYGNGLVICVAVTDDIFNTGEDVNAHFYNGIPSGLIYIAIENRESFSRLINWLNAQSKIDTLQATFLIPPGLADGDWKIYNNNISYQYIAQTNNPVEIGGISIDRPETLGFPTTYTPKNNKLLTYPYLYLATDNNAGSSNIYKFEDESLGNVATLAFVAQCNLSVGCDIKYVPDEYKGIPNIVSYGFNGAKLPVGSWINQTFNNWITQNGLNIAIDNLENMTGMSLMTSITNSSGYVTPNVTSGLFGAMRNVAKINQAMMLPNQSKGNVGSSNIAYSLGKIGATFNVMTIRSEFAKIIDEFFSMFGYKINRVKAPNITGRKNWNYVKTINCNFSGNDIPQTDMQTIRNMFDNGVTLWHNPNTIYNYNNSNNIV